MRTLCICLVVMIGLNGCKAITPPIKREALTENKNHWFAYDSNYRGAILLDSSTGKFCAEPSPDTATTGTFNLTINAERASVIDASAGLSGASTLTRLSERSQAVLVLRESMYRLCEQSLNGNISDAQYLSAFTAILNTIKVMFDAELANAQADQNQSKAALAREMKDLTPDQLLFFNSRL
ncbi:hypothetical protein [Achromobacter kerstersii]|uniref:hypothetical protein n=1 Tax=Achromobacter kerstersii TaxID=1353890 RepID=UPI00313DBB50